MLSKTTVKPLSQTQKTVLSALFLAVGFVLPFFTGQLRAIGNKLLPMHIPVFLCGFVCGPYYAAAVGFVLPLLRSIIFNMPVMYPRALAMAFELAAYGFFTGLFSKLFGKSLWANYLTLTLSMLAGRAVWGVSLFLLMGFRGTVFTLPEFFAGAFIGALPGIIIQFIIIPPLVYCIDKIRR